MRYSPIASASSFPHATHSLESPMSDEILNGAAAESQAQPQAASFTVE